MKQVQTEATRGPDALLAGFARRLRGDARFMAALLDQYARRHGVAFEALAAELACSDISLVRLALCLKPSGEASPSRKEVGELARFCRIDGERLERLIRDAFAGMGAGEGVD